MSSHSAQGDLFGNEPTAKFTPRIPKQRHVRNALIRLVGEMEEADQWPWLKSVTKRNKDHWLEHLCTLLNDEKEADEWRARIKKQTIRLDAAEQLPVE